jgi:hypothetical protein
VGGLIVVSQRPPVPESETKKKPPLMPNPGNRFWERRAERKGPVPKPTEAPPLVKDDVEKAKTDTTAASGAKAAEEKASVQAVLKSSEKSGTQKDDESLAAEKLKQAKAFQAQKNFAKAKECCQKIINKYPHTKALEEAVLLSNELK